MSPRLDSRRATRSGLSLMEVLVALTILTFSALALARLAATGRQHLVRSVRITHAQNLCYGKLNEIRAGVLKIDESMEADFVPFPHDEEWSYFAKVSPTERPGVVAVEVAVMPTKQGTGPDALVEPKATYRMVQWMRKSQLPGVMMAAEPGGDAQGMTPGADAPVGILP